MANPRLPALKAEVTGAAARSPGRYADKAKPKGTRALGEPYAKMTDGQREAWAEFRDELPWLNSSHRALLQVACVLRARLNDDPEMGVNALQAYSAVLSKLAATPIDETKVNYGGEEEANPTEQYFH